ncbi:MAG: hypothetical protein HKN31_07735 [Pricia sp.]|nr:hypothetical protein [Pricia sp.]
MKKCLLMFVLLVITLLLAVLTERKQVLVLDESLAAGEDVIENPLLVQEQLNLSTNE